MYKDIETGETVTKDQLMQEYQEAVKAGSVDETEKTFNQYVHNCLASFGGTLIELKEGGVKH